MPQGFGDILNLVPLAEHVMKLTAVCLKCNKEASFTKRKGSETEVSIGEIDVNKVQLRFLWKIFCELR